MREYARPFYAARGAIFLAAIFFAACEDEPPLSRLELTAEFIPSELDFGEVTVGTTKALQVELKNTSATAIELTSVETPDSFVLRGEKEVLEGTLLAAGDSIFLNAVFVSQEEGEKSGEIKVGAHEAEAILKVRANGVVRRLPVLTLEPGSLDFGTVEIGQQARATVMVRNTGNAPGTIESAMLESTAALVDGSSQYGVATALPITIGENETAQLEIVFRSSFEGPRADRMTFNAAAPHGPLSLTLQGIGAAARGGLICQPSTVDFGPVERGQTAQQAVRCTARQGQVRFVGASFAASAQYFYLPSPPGTVDLRDGEGIDLALEFRPEGLPDVYRSDLIVQFNGAMGLEEVRIPVRGELVPPPVTATAVSIVLRWDTNLSDMDVHFLRPGGRMFANDGGDCYYAQMEPDWGRIGDRTDDPFLDVDDTDGFGPETINMSSSAAADYELWVHSFSDQRRRTTRATVEVYLGGTLAGTFTQAMDCLDTWHVGTVRWNGSSGTFQPNGRIGAANEGFCF